MGAAAISASKNTHSQISSLGYKYIGCTPMIGQNDCGGEIFSESNAKLFITWAKQQEFINTVSFWSLNRDHTGNGALYQASNCNQSSNYAFSAIFSNFFS